MPTCRTRAFERTRKNPGYTPGKKPGRTPGRQAPPMMLREFAKALGVDRHLAARVARRIPGTRQVAGRPGQFERLEIPDDAIEHVTKEIVEEERAALGSSASVESPPSDPALREEELAVRREKLATEKIRAETARLQAEAELSGAKQRREVQLRAEEVERRTHRLRLRELEDTRRRLLGEIQEFEIHLEAMRLELDHLHQLSADTRTRLEMVRGHVKAEEQAIARARARRAEVEAELAATQADLGAMAAELRAVRDEAAALKGECEGYVAAAREQVAAMEAEEADWLAATRAFVALWRGPAAGAALRTLMTLSATIAAAGVMDEAAALAELRRRLFRFFLPALEEIAALLDRRDLSDEQRVVEARKLLARVREQRNTG